MRIQAQGKATISGDGRYRYRLERRWDNSADNLVVCMLNPSTADGSKDDATVTRLIRRAASLGYGGLTVVNLYAYRATDPRELWAKRRAGQDVIGPDNDDYIYDAFTEARDVLLAWGSLPVASTRDEHVISMLGKRDGANRALCLGLTDYGYPLHPLHVAYSVRLRAYTGRYACIYRSVSSAITAP